MTGVLASAGGIIASSAVTGPSGLHVTVDHTKVTGPLTKFPVYVDLSDLGNPFWLAVSDGGGGIRCTVGGDPVPREIVSCDTTSESGEMWVRTDLSTTVDTVISVEVTAGSEPLAGSAYGSQAVWSNGFIGVWHLEGLTDSTVDGFDLTEVGSPLAKVGLLGAGAGGFSGVNWLSAGNPPGLQRDDLGFTMSAWAKWSGNTARLQMVVDHGNVADRGVGLMLWSGVWSGYAQGQIGTAVQPVSDQWTYLAVTSGRDLFVDGVDETTTRGGSGGSVGTNDFHIGTQSKASSRSSRFFWGDVDEVRVASVERSAGWLAAEYVNQSDPAGFYTVS